MATMLASAAGATSAATLNEAQLDGLLAGNTVYLSIPVGNPARPEGGIVPFKYGADGTASVRLSDDLTLVGTWSINSDHYCVDWSNGPKNSCTKVVKSQDGIDLVDPKSGDSRGTIERIVPGNPEQL